MAQALDCCMECENPPTHEVLWANAKGHAWFCDDCYDAWVSKNPGEIVSERKVKDGRVSRQWSREEKALLEEKGIWEQIVKYTGSMVAFFMPPDVASDLEGRRYPPGSEVTPAGDMHVTLAYLPEVADIEKGELIQIVSDMAKGSSPIQAKLGGIGRFLNPNGDDQDAYYASVDAPALADFRQRLAYGLKASDFQIGTDHGFTPHCTLAYIPSGVQTPDVLYKPIECTFDALWVAWGDERVSFPLLGQPIAQRITQAVKGCLEGISGVAPVDGLMGEIEDRLKNIEKAFAATAVWPERNTIIDVLGSVFPLSRPSVDKLADAIEEAR